MQSEKQQLGRRCGGGGGGGGNQRIKKQTLNNDPNSRVQLFPLTPRIFSSVTSIRGKRNASLFSSSKDNDLQNASHQRIH